MSEPSKEHSQGQGFVTWDAHTRHEERLTGVERNLDKLSTLTESLAGSVAVGREEQGDHFNRIHEKMESNSATISRQREVSWPLVVSLITATAMMVGGGVSFVLLLIAPLHKVDESTAKNVSVIENDLKARRQELRLDYEKFGYNRAKIEDHGTLITDIKTRIHTLEVEVSSQGAQIQRDYEFSQRTNAYGSQKWLGSSGKSPPSCECPME